MLSNNTEEEFKLRTIFKQFDLNQSGGISVIELAAMLAKLGVLVDNKYIEAMFKQIDTNNNGIIEFSEFANLVIYNPYKWYVYNLILSINIQIIDLGLD